ncbi:hypothetical protein JCM8547_000747 [Rhodosporidiobolus lusitaniae]
MDGQQALAQQTYAALSGTTLHPNHLQLDEQSLGAFDPHSSFVDMSRLSPRSRTYSNASVSSVASHSSIASVQSSFFGDGTPATSEGTRPSVDLSPVKLHPGGAEGFNVELPGAGTWGVRWTELLGLLAQPETTAFLPQDHLVKQLARFVQAQPAASFDRPTTGLSVVNNDLNTLGLQDEALPTLPDGQFFYQPPQEAPLDDSHYMPVPPRSSRQRPPEPIRTSGTYVTPLQRAFIPHDSIDQIGTAVPLDPNQPSFFQPAPPPVLPTLPALPTDTDTVSTHLPPPITTDIHLSSTATASAFNSPFSASTTPHQPLPPTHIPSQRAHAPSNSQDSLVIRPATLAATRHLRPTNSPYARRQPLSRHVSHASVSSTSSSTRANHFDRARSASVSSSRSSSVDFSSASVSGSDYDPSEDYYEPPRASHAHKASTSSASHAKKKSTATGGNQPRTLRPLNRETESYLWVASKSQLSKIPPGVSQAEVMSRAEEGAEVVVFGPGSYYKVFDEEELEILPSDTRTRVNAWLRGQSCVDNCAFRFDTKRPSVIRQHVVTCKARSNMIGRNSGTDPLKRLCQLQLDAQSTEAKLKMSRVNSHVVEPSGFHDRPLPPDPPPSATFTAVSGDGNDDRRSVHSHRSTGSSSSYYASRSFEGEGVYAQQQGGWSPGQAAQGSSPFSHDSQSSGFTPPGVEPAEQAYQGYATSSFSSFSSDPLAGSSGDNNWLGGYGLAAPTGSDSAQYGQVHSYSSTPSGLHEPVSNSFLSMDE